MMGDVPSEVDSEPRGPRCSPFFGLAFVASLR